jgi:hypothetical protein
MRKARFKSQERPGFSMTFENGWTISVQWHSSAYCERKQTLGSYKEDLNPAESPNAEIAMWDKHGNWYMFEHEEVLGYQTPDQVADWMEVVKSLKEDENAI